ncbi:MAG TPA: protein-glutamate O-methyltransferase CheR [Pseudobdellovibrionaceae bacterium]|nr:protein-glutamate O-methyltransferase CheR [Pseudobdellovibrionaceae bacterium]
MSSSQAAPRVLPNYDAFQLSEREFAYFQSAIDRMAGIHLAESKRELVQSRLRGHVISLGYDSFTRYREHLESLPPSHADWQEFINLLTTNKTDFFREAAHFQFLKETVIPKWLTESKSQTFKVWCAASSTGEEPYTISMVLDSCLPEDRSYSVHATDIDTDVLKKARAGVYPCAKLSEIPPEYRRGFDLGTGDIKDWMRVKPHLKSKVSFSRFNLNGSNPPPEGEFDLIFCRNVLIYFTPATIEGVMKKLYRVTKPGGLLLIGHSESLQNVGTDWRAVKPSVYFKKEKE